MIKQIAYGGGFAAIVLAFWFVALYLEIREKRAKRFDGQPVTEAPSEHVYSFNFKL